MFFAFHSRPLLQAWNDGMQALFTVMSQTIALRVGTLRVGALLATSCLSLEHFPNKHMTERRLMKKQINLKSKDEE